MRIKFYNDKSASVAQLVEQRIRNAWVEGSNPFGSLVYEDGNGYTLRFK